MAKKVTYLLIPLARYALMREVSSDGVSILERIAEFENRSLGNKAGHAWSEWERRNLDNSATTVESFKDLRVQ